MKKQIRSSKTQIRPRKDHSEKSDFLRNVGFKYIDDSYVHDPQKLHVFIQWLAIPRDLREVKTFKALAKRIGVSQDTLTDWKKLPNFWNEVSQHRDQEYRRYSTAIAYCLVKQAQAGDVGAIKLFFQLFEKFDDKAVIEKPVSKLDKAESKEVAMALENMGFSLVSRGSKSPEK